MPAFWGIIPSENAVIICSVAITYLGIILRAPDILLIPEVFLPKLVDQPGEGPQKAFFHGRSKRSKPLRVVLILAEYALKSRIPSIEGFLFSV